MKYMGSKSRHAKEIISKILSHPSSEGKKCWVEPFVGGANVIDKVNIPRRIGNDINSHVIDMFTAIQNGWIPPCEITEHEYRALRDMSKDGTSDPMIGFAGIGCSYSGKWFGGYARGDGRNYCRESRDNLLRQRDGIVGVEFVSTDYRNLDIPENSVVYCDPPYASSTGYSCDFDHKEFWGWCDNVALSNNVFVSEYTAPDGWTEIWSKPVNSSLTKDTGSKKAVEKLFHKPGGAR